MYLEQLRSFCAIVEQGSVTRAARHLHLTQPAVSQHLRSLERTFGLVLLERLGGHVQPTEAGTVVYEGGRVVIAQLDRMQLEVAGLRSLRAGHVVFAAGKVVGEYMLPQAVAAFRRLRSEIQVDMRVAPSTHVYEQVLDGSVDFGIALDANEPDLAQNLTIEPLYRERVVLVAAPHHPILARWPSNMPLGALASVPLVAHSEQDATRRLYEEWLQGLGVQPRIAMEFDNAESIKHVVAAGEGAAFMYYSRVALDVAAERLRVFEFGKQTLFAEFVLARRSDRHLSPAAAALVASIVGTLEHDARVSGVNVHAAERFSARLSVDTLGAARSP